MKPALRSSDTTTRYQAFQEIVRKNVPSVCSVKTEFLCHDITVWSTGNMVENFYYFSQRSRVIGRPIGTRVFVGHDFNINSPIGKLIATVRLYEDNKPVIGYNSDNELLARRLSRALAREGFFYPHPQIIPGVSTLSVPAFWFL